VTVLRASAVFDAPTTVLTRVLRRADLWTRTARAIDATADIAPAAAGDPRAPLRDGQLIRVRGGAPRRIDAVLPPRPLLLRVTQENGQPPTLDLVAGPLARCEVVLTVTPEQAGCRVEIAIDVTATSPAVASGARRRAARAATLLLGITVLILAEEPAVVAAAIVREGSVLVARRTAPAALAGKWELPGGKVQPGETQQAALRREIAEELGLVLTVGERIGDPLELPDGAILRCYAAVTDGAAPTLAEHDELRWVVPGELESIDWLPADRLLMGALEQVLRRS
jgi:8-oxo-dGTP diphosphatase